MAEEHTEAPEEEQKPEPLMHTMQDDAEGRPAPLVAPPPKAQPGGAAPAPADHPLPPPPPPPPPSALGNIPVASEDESAAPPSPDTESANNLSMEDPGIQADPFAGESADESDASAGKKRLIIIGGGVLLVLLLIGGGIFAWQTGVFSPDETPPAPMVQPDPEPEPEPDPEPEPEPDPVLRNTEVLTAFGSTAFVAETFDDASAFFEDLLTQSQPGSEPVTVQISDANGSAYALSEALLAAGLRMDPDVTDVVDEFNYSLLVVNDTEAGAGRFGFVVAISASSIETLKAEMLDWEETLGRDSQTLLTSLGFSEPLPEDLIFETFTRDDGRTIHYANLAGPALALDYVVDESGSYLMFATSRESMSALLEAL